MLLVSLLLLLLSNGLTVRKDVSILYSRLGLFILMYCVLSAYASTQFTIIEKGFGLYNGLFSATDITHVFQPLVFITSLIILLLTSFYPRKIYGYISEKINIDRIVSQIINKMAEHYIIIEYALIILFVVLGGSLLQSSGDFMSAYLCIELQSYGLYIICVITRDSEFSTSSGLTYFLLGGVSSCFILFGIAAIYVNSGLSNLDGFYGLTNLTSDNEGFNTWYDSQYINYSLLIISVGLLFKIGAAPFHFWAPDVYDGIPTTVTTFVAIVAKISILVLMLDLVHYTSETVAKTTFDWTTGILISCLLSLIIGTVLGLSQTRIKRLFSYSTISHVGFILLALGVNTIESSKAFIFYLIQYTFANLDAFVILVSIGFSLYLYANNNLVFIKLKDKNYSPIQLISQIKGYSYINPILALSLTIVMLSFVGLPPLVGFFSKQMVLSSALDNGFVFLVFISIFTSVIGAVYYLGIIKTMFFDKSDYTTDELEFNTTLSSNLTLISSILTLGILFFILIPDEILNLSDILSIISFTDNTYFVDSSERPDFDNRLHNRFHKAANNWYAVVKSQQNLSNAFDSMGSSERSLRRIYTEVEIQGILEARQEFSSWLEEAKNLSGLGKTDMQKHIEMEVFLDENCKKFDKAVSIAQTISLEKYPEPEDYTAYRKSTVEIYTKLKDAAHINEMLKRLNPAEHTDSATLKRLSIVNPTANTKVNFCSICEWSNKVATFKK